MGAARKIEQIRLDTGEAVRVFPSVKAAAESLYGKAQNISDCARGRIKSAYGYGWRYSNGGSD